MSAERKGDEKEDKSIETLRRKIMKIQII